MNETNNVILPNVDRNFTQVLEDVGYKLDVHVDEDGVLVSPTADELTTANPGLGSSNGSVGHSLYVDAVTGDNSTGTSGRFDKPFLTPAAAKSAAVSGDTIYVRPGSYTITATLAKAGVNWDFAPGTTVTMATAGAEAIWDDGNTAMSFNVTGECDFLRTGGASGDVHGIRLRHASSNFNIECRDFSATGLSGGASIAVLKQEAGRIVLKGRIFDARALTGPILGYTLWWVNGSGEVHANRLTADYVTVWSNVDSAPTGDFHVFAAEIRNAIFTDGASAAAAAWIHFDILDGRENDGSVFTAGNQVGTGNKIYLTGQKIFGFIQSQSFDGLLYVDIQKHEAVGNGVEDNTAAFFLWSLGIPSTGTCFYRADHWDQKAFTGPIIQIDSGIVEINVGRFVATASTATVLIKGGETRIQGKIDVSANAAATPLTMKTGGGSATVSLRGTKLIAGASAKSITNADSGTYTVSGWGAYANKDVSSGITADGLVVDSSVI